MTAQTELQDALEEKSCVVDTNLITIQSDDPDITDHIQGIVDVDKAMIVNPRVFREELAKLVTVTEHGTPVEQKKLGSVLGGPQTETYDDVIVHRYEFTKVLRNENNE